MASSITSMAAFITRLPSKTASPFTPPSRCEVPGYMVACRMVFVLQRRARPRRAMLTALVLCFAGSARGDSVFLRGGEKLMGRIISEEAGKVVFESQNLGKLELARDRIERLERDAPVPVAAPISTNGASGSGGGARTNAFYPWLTSQALGNSNRNDWIQIKSGEWLRGRIKSLQDDRLDFDSEELDLLSFDWKKICTLRSPRLQSVGIENLQRVEGSVIVTTNEV